MLLKDPGVVMTHKTEKIRVLNHGFVQLLDVMGSDSSICQAARISYDNFDVQRKPDDDRKLIRYMMSHRHTSPFEMAVLQFRICCPMYTGEQWLRHRTGSFNKLSGRYSEMPTDSFEIPPQDDWRIQSQENKQGSDDELRGIHFELNVEVAQAMNSVASVYQKLLHAGVAREQARVVLPAATMTEFVWKTDLHNLLHFLQLRMDSHAQQEIRQYAEIIAGIVSDLFPLTWEAFEDYRLKAVTFSRMEQIALKRLYAGVSDFDGLGMSGREIKGFLAKVKTITGGGSD
jgi:thymidylate synthase (FAD)